MKTLIASLTCTLILHVTGLGANEPAPTPPVPQVAPTPLPSPPQPHAGAANHSEQQLSTVEHLRRAAAHLEAAGADELARRVREEADGLAEASVEQLNQKREQIARLQREIAELEEATGCSRQIMLRCKVFDVDVHALRDVGFSKTFSPGIADAARMDVIIREWVASGIAKILAEPVLVTTNGRPARLRSGGEFPILLPTGPDKGKIEWRNLGLTLEVVPVVQGDGRIRLDVAPELATRELENAVMIDGFLVPELNVRRMNTQVELEFGETATLVMPAPGAIEKVRQASAEEGGDGEQTVTIFCVTPERVRPMSAPPVPDPQPLPTY